VYSVPEQSQTAPGPIYTPPGTEPSGVYEGGNTNSSNSETAGGTYTINVSGADRGNSVVKMVLTTGVFVVMGAVMLV
jgi:hypothetical protein